MNDGQQVAVMAAVSSIVGVTIGYFQNRYGKRIDREGTRDVRQTAIEDNLRQQCTDCLHRVDQLERDKTTMEAAFRTEIEGGAKERREIERQYREDIRKLEDDLDKAHEALNDLRHKNWLLERKAIGSGELSYPLPRKGEEPDPMSYGDDS